MQSLPLYLHEQINTKDSSSSQKEAQLASKTHGHTSLIADHIGTLQNNSTKHLFHHMISLAQLQRSSVLDCVATDNTAQHSLDFNTDSQ